MSVPALLACAVLVLQGGVVTMDQMEAASDRAVLENVAVCFFDAVAFLQKTPALPEEYALLLAEAKGVLDGLGIRLGEGDFSTLTWSDDGLALLTPSGLPISCALTGEEHDDSEEGTAWFFTYAFSIPGDSVPAIAVVELDL